MSLYSKRFSGIEIENDGKSLVLRKKDSSLFASFDNSNNDFNIKGSITSSGPIVLNSLTLNDVNKKLTRSDIITSIDSIIDTNKNNIDDYIKHSMYT